MKIDSKKGIWKCQNKFTLRLKKVSWVALLTTTNVDILSKVISLQCSYIKRQYDNSSHPWKMLPCYLIDTYLGKNVKFRSIICIPANKIKRFPIHCKQIFQRWSENLSSFTNLPSLLRLKLSGITNVPKQRVKPCKILECHKKYKLCQTAFQMQW